MTKQEETTDVRVRFGGVLRFHRERRDVSLRSVADRCGVSVGVVEAWEAGEQLPDGGQWKRLCQMVDRGLFAFRNLYDQAREAAMVAARERGAKSVGVDTKINTALGDKLVGVQLKVVPPPAPDPEPARTQRPPGWRSSAAIAGRRAFVRNLLTARPRMRTSGADSVIEACRQAFGVGVSLELVDEVREELQRERVKADIMRELPAPTPPTVPAMAMQLVKHAVKEDPSIIETVVQLLLESMPNLERLTVSVNTSGEAEVSYSLRKVVTESGTMTVKS